jgi:hypothetical protein
MTNRRSARIERHGGSLVAVLLLTLASSASASDRHPHPSIPWIVTQAIPSPEHTGRSFGLRWQVTPFLWSWGIHRNAPRRWRAFVIEPSMRHSGSFEIYASPEWLRDRGFFGRAGLRSYFPVAERGEALSISIGTNAWYDHGRVGPSVELGAYTLYGFLGVLLTHSPQLVNATWTVTLQVRVL